jgi:high-affinity iron transporter
MAKYRKLFLMLIIALLVTQTTLALDNPPSAFSKANELVSDAITLAEKGNITEAKGEFQKFIDAWKESEDGIKAQSKQAYGDIEDRMGMVKFFLSKDPVDSNKLIVALKDLKSVNEDFVNGKYLSTSSNQKQEKITINDLLKLLDTAKQQIHNKDYKGALSTMNTFSSYWLDVEGVILTKSVKVYKDAETDMVNAKAYLSLNSVQPDNALKTIDHMYGYLSPLAGETSYTMVDVITIILREGLEALLVVIALLGFLKKSGHDDKKSWIYGGVISGLAVSVVIAVIVQVLFKSGTFGNNNFLISGWTGVFAAVMLIYVSYWLHSKSSTMEWQNYIERKSTQALATSSLFSLGVLSFLAVFREGTETVLFYIGMASSISLRELILGIVLGVVILVVIALIILKLGVRIPMKPFFVISSLLVFYLGIKFTGMGINGLQLAGLIPATANSNLPAMQWLAMYPTWECFIPQTIIIILAIITVLLNSLKSTFRRN